MTSPDPGRTAYEARFAHEKVGYFRRWEDLSDDARAVWQRVEAACQPTHAPLVQGSIVPATKGTDVLNMQLAREAS